MNNYHTPVLLSEAISFLSPKNGEIFVDCTLGGGGHSKAILEKLGKSGLLVGVDQDNDALKTAEKNLAKFKNKKLIKANFSEVDTVLSKIRKLHPRTFKDGAEVSGILADLGTSSYQFDEATRGFSYKFPDQELDMRMDQKSNKTAENIVNEYELKELESIFRELGEEKNARKIANLIKSARPIKTVGELLKAIEPAFSPRLRFAKKEPVWASNVFRALRMEVNSELKVLGEFLEKAPKLLSKNGRLAIITFHSIEDRIVKKAFLELAKPIEINKITGQIVKNSNFKIITKKPIIPTEKELKENPRAKSAKLRVLERA